MFEILTGGKNPCCTKFSELFKISFILFFPLQMNMLILKVEMLQDRLKEREEAMEKKVRQITHLQNDKTRLDLEMSGLRDSLDDTNAKVTSQQRKVVLPCPPVI